MINTTLHCTALHCTALHYTTLHYTTLHYTTLHYTTLHYTTLHYTTLHYTTLQSYVNALTGMADLLSNTSRWWFHCVPFASDASDQTCHMVRIVRIQYGCWPFLGWYGRIKLWYGFQATYGGEIVSPVVCSKTKVLSSTQLHFLRQIWSIAVFIGNRLA